MVYASVCNSIQIGSEFTCLRLNVYTAVIYMTTVECLLPSSPLPFVGILYYILAAIFRNALLFCFEFLFVSSAHINALLIALNICLLLMPIYALLSCFKHFFITYAYIDALLSCFK